MRGCTRPHEQPGKAFTRKPGKREQTRLGLIPQIGASPDPRKKVYLHTRRWGGGGRAGFVELLIVALGERFSLSASEKTPGDPGNR